ncbi:hypothetical protein HDV00_006979, partial [Rhizophlyctis rosea]
IVDRDEDCETCDPVTFKRIYLAKQNVVKHFLVTHGIKFTTVDRPVDDGKCGKERPDFYIDCGTHILMIEVNEHQHSGRPCECEQTRMVNISQSNGMKTMFLCWNPDKYKAKPGRKNETMGRLLDVLLEFVGHYSINPPKGFLEVIYLYFDGYAYGEETTETILAMEDYMSD